MEIEVICSFFCNKIRMDLVGLSNRKFDSDDLRTISYLDLMVDLDPTKHIYSKINHFKGDSEEIRKFLHSEIDRQVDLIKSTYDGDINT